MKLKNGFFIGELAKQAQVTVDTIRYYEKIGLLPKPKRLVSRYRIYESKALDRLIFIKQAQELGLSLAQISELLQFQKNDRSACLKVQEVLAGKIKEIDQRIKTLKNFRGTLNTFLTQCNAVLEKKTDTACPILEELPHIP